ncbi:hypothetical protein H6G97_23895 [Nostoc flagelliforme FACHB-838]|uniref:Uncharacterized protein n=1 Tax=Nostoc flagelliforme FACHB-838 TaxID=2692904 RepID=A0ABR8DU87_9NOSO|nr:hypothetical protein [Nostoc flagelliforme]MBD2532460.1 hypothetical protein [Nostoc flagelliforme FACHB-838]
MSALHPKPPHHREQLNSLPTWRINDPTRHRQQDPLPSRPLKSIADISYYGVLAERRSFASTQYDRPKPNYIMFDLILMSLRA